MLCHVDPVLLLTSVNIAPKHSDTSPTVKIYRCILYTVYLYSIRVVEPCCRSIDA